MKDMETITTRTSKKNEMNSQKRKKLLEMLCLPETTSDEDILRALDVDNKEFNLSDFKKEGGPVLDEDKKKKD